MLDDCLLLDVMGHLTRGDDNCRLGVLLAQKTKRGFSLVKQLITRIDLLLPVVWIQFYWVSFEHQGLYSSFPQHLQSF